jgi:hypothetical protein
VQQEQILRQLDDLKAYTSDILLKLQQDAEDGLGDQIKEYIQA